MARVYHNVLVTIPKLDIEDRQAASVGFGNGRALIYWDEEVEADCDEPGDISAPADEVFLSWV